MKNKEEMTLVDSLIFQSKEIIKLKVIIAELSRIKAKIASLRHNVTKIDYVDILKEECHQAILEKQTKLANMINILIEPLGCEKFEYFSLSSSELKEGYISFSKKDSVSETYILPLSSIDNGLINFEKGKIEPFPNENFPFNIFPSVL